MKRLGLLTPIAAGLVITAILVSCSSDRTTSSSVDPLSVPGNDPTLTTAANLSGGGWSPPVEQAASNSNSKKVSVCHSGNGQHYTQIDVAPQAARVHLGDSKTGKGGHVGDYRVSDLTPCPPPATPGKLQICKVAGVGLATGASFTFTVTANGVAKNVTVAAGAGPTGTCVSAGDFRVGTTVDVKESAQQGVSATGIVATPAGAMQGTADLASGSATVIAGAGTTTLTFTNKGPTGTLVICKVGGTGVTAGSNFTFKIGDQTATVAAGAAPNGTCGAPLTVAAGSLTLSENPTTGMVVQTIAGTPSPTNVSLPLGTATTVITAGQESRITFTNAAASATNSGTLTICKVGGTGVTAGTNFTFSVAGQTVTVAAGAGPNGTCAATPLTLAAGPVTVSENAAAGTTLQAIVATPAAAATNVNLGSRSATVQITAGQDTKVTFTNVAP